MHAQHMCAPWLQGEGLRTVELTLEELQTRFRKHVQAATIQCAGNRRNEMKEVKPVGLAWNEGQGQEEKAGGQGQEGMEGGQEDEVLREPIDL